MKNDFTTLVDRSSMNSMKWGGMKRKMAVIPSGIVPFSTADMEFKTSSAITETMREYLKDAVLGYYRPGDDYKEAVRGWYTRRHHYTPNTDQMLTTPGVISALHLAIESFTAPDEKVLIMSPSYPMFFRAVEHHGRELVVNKLICENDRYTIDFEDFEEKCRDPKVTMFILCSPHNPSGRVWTKEELMRIHEITLANHVFVVADEIHNDLVLPGHTHTMYGTLCPEAEQNCMMCTSCSKTFNLAGMKIANIFVPNKEKFDIINAAANATHMTELNTLGYISCIAAYTKAEDWLDELLEVLDENRKLVEETLAEKLPMLKAAPLEGTYLMWIDMRALGMEPKELDQWLVEKALWFTSAGYTFLDTGDGFTRLDIAVPKKVLEEALDRLVRAVEDLQK